MTLMRALISGSRRFATTAAQPHLPTVGVVDLQFRDGGYRGPVDDADAIERNVAAGRARVVYTGAKAVEEVPAAELATFDALLFRRCLITRSGLAMMPRLKSAVRMGVGFENVDVNACKDAGVIPSYMPDSWVEEVADTSISHILALVRRTHRLASHVALGHGWTAQANLPNLGLRRLRGLRLGIVGLGKIGLGVALRAQPFGFRTSFYDPFVRVGTDKGLGMTRHFSVEALLADSDIVTLHCPYNEATHHLLRAETLPKQPIYVVNCCRGAVIHEADLLKALRAGRLLGLGMDCMETEPFVTPELGAALADPTLNLMVTPHMSFYSDEAYATMRRLAINEALRVIEGRGARFQIGASS